ncbi:MAG TPA: nickel-binding protein [Chitinophagaceae bacterium]|nr:nickel-binding protein [Chitinophagaceae bacterium]
MPLYMDVHILPGVKAKNVAEAHQKDLAHQEEYGCTCMTYWIDEARENVFCLIKAPSKEAVEEMHGKAHGLIPNKVIEVNTTLVESFLGRIYDPADALVSDDGLKIFEDPSFRLLLVTKICDPVLLKHHYGERANEIIAKHNQIIRKNLIGYGGREAEHDRDGFVISFTSASKAVACALNIQQQMLDTIREDISFRIALNAGEPVERSRQLFGDTIHLADAMCCIVKDTRIAIATGVKDIVAKDILQDNGKKFLILSPKDEKLLESLFTTLKDNWQNAEFDMDQYCKATAMSASQLYRKAISLTGVSPNILMKDYRLGKAKELMRKRPYNIAQITFDSGFTSASYFTKCFKKKYGLLPMAYLELLK